METVLSRLAEIVGGEVDGDGQKPITAAGPFESAGSDEITYAGSAKFLKRLDETKAGAIIVPKTFRSAGKNLIKVENPQVAFAAILSYFNPPTRRYKGISSACHIGKQLTCGTDVSIAPHAVIGDDVSIGDRTQIYPNVVICDRVTIGNGTVIYPNVTIRENSVIGSRVIIHAGTVIGSDGYGFAQDGNTHVKIPQLGTVQIDDDVEIGAVNTIDRAAFDKTWIQRGVKTDNLVHIGHNVIIGEDSLIIAQVGISGSVTVGKNVIIAGQAGVNHHLTIGDNARIAARGKVYRSVPPGQTISGTHMPHSLWLRLYRILPQLPELKKRLVALEKKLGEVLAKLPESRKQDQRSEGDEHRDNN